ncbi:hypothetical protein Bdt_1995 [Bdellovibrio bacteriovorus str. Tiberius]|uniref:Uncharacterized protein n=2 Tax=Bdellovibrio bacteriovorus TaxID=959 RepID=K7ZFN8_BDEBC|nr:hypothetical protein Bdt_1995 [Bdellovibrio bacteriovorus str. Tiberius]
MKYNGPEGVCMQGEVQEPDQDQLQKGAFDEGFIEDDLNPRSKTSLRMNYEAQVTVIQRQIGNLEQIRGDLGLSQRKISQLLMVDPSSWTRWVKQGDEAPPHIWRALQWYLALREKIPGLTPNYFLGSSPQVLHQRALQEVDLERQARREEIEKLSLELRGVFSEREKLKSELQELKKDLKFHRNISIVVLLIGLAWAGVFFFWKGL